MGNDQALLAKIRNLAQAEGFELAAAMPLRDLADQRIDSWLKNGYDGEMAYIAKYRNHRINPEVYFAPYRSVVSFILPYDVTPPSNDPTIGNIARYALGDDYHDVIKKRLFRVIDALRDEDDSLDLRALVDTAPLMEKVAAERSGLGWQGKHSNVIREGQGSWFFLAEILVNRDLESESESSNRCGTCVDCIEVCPSRAIVAPYVVDSRLCISYLTIELRGAMPRELRHFIGNRIFGCDDCQEVCPWNRLAALPAMEEFRPREGLRDRALVDWIRLDIEEWRKIFSKSAVKRTKYDGFMRNVAVALGNSLDTGAVGVMRDVYPTSSPLVRAHLVWALRKIGGEEAETALIQLRAMEADAAVLREFYGEVDEPLGGESK